MTRRDIAILGTWLSLAGLASAAECPLDRATYTEMQSGAVIAFHPKDMSEDGITVMALFDLRLPNIDTVYRGEIALNMGRYARPDGSIAQDCTQEEAQEWPDACWLWTGPVYAIGTGTAELIEEPDMSAPDALLFAEFGRSMAMNETFGMANPDGLAYDVFAFSGCLG